jgi:hypothetical protein
MREAASFDWETLIPVIFFILYGIAQFLGSKKKGDAVEEEGDEPRVDPVERARQIREEIRRKIEERRQEMEGGQPRPIHEARRVAHDPAVPEVQRREPVLAAPGPAPSPQASMMQRLEAQRQKLEDARRQQREAHQQALRIEQQAGAFHHKELGIRKKEDGPLPADVLRGQLLAGLRSPAGLRNAVLYREILDPPLGLR